MTPEELGRYLAERFDTVANGKLAEMMGAVEEQPPPSADDIIRDIRKTMQTLRSLPDWPRFALYPHDLGPYQCYLISKTQVEGLPRPPDGRQVVIVPRVKLHEIYDQMKRLGVDVATMPIYGIPQTDDEETA